MSAFLLDVNALLALAWPSHVHHHRVQHWLAAHQARGWATCTVTQLGFVRISSQPAFSPDCKSPQEAIALLRRLTALKRHKFLNAPDNGFEHDGFDAVFSKVLTHHHVTDAYLITLAKVHRVKLATLDEALCRLFPGETAKITSSASA